MKRGDLTVTGGTITGAADGILIDNPSGGYVVDGAMSVDISGGVVTGTSGYAVRERVPSGGSCARPAPGSPAATLPAARKA